MEARQLGANQSRIAVETIKCAELMGDLRAMEPRQFGAWAGGWGDGIVTCCAHTADAAEDDREWSFSAFTPSANPEDLTAATMRFSPCFSNLVALSWLCCYFF